MEWVCEMTASKNRWKSTMRVWLKRLVEKANAFVFYLNRVPCDKNWQRRTWHKQFNQRACLLEIVLKKKEEEEGLCVPVNRKYRPHSAVLHYFFQVDGCVRPSTRVFSRQVCTFPTIELHTSRLYKYMIFSPLGKYPAVVGCNGLRPFRTQLTHAAVFSTTEGGGYSRSVRSTALSVLTDLKFSKRIVYSRNEATHCCSPVDGLESISRDSPMMNQ